MAAQHMDILAEDLHKSFGSNHVLCGIDVQVRAGEMIAIVGGSGCGKTVLLEHFIGHLTPDSGRVLIADYGTPGHPLVDINAVGNDELDRIRVHWAVVFQRNALFSGTVLENIGLWLREIRNESEEAIHAIAIESLKAVGFNQVESLLMRDRDDLSGGMAKRVSIARALAMNPDIIFFDEPTAGLDPTHAKQIHELIGRTHLRHDLGGDARTSVIVTHDKDLLYRLRPRIIMLHEGRVYFDGDYDTFEKSDSPIILPYFELMPGLQKRRLRDVQ